MDGSKCYSLRSLVLLCSWMLIIPGLCDGQVLLYQRLFGSEEHKGINNYTPEENNAIDKDLGWGSSFSWADCGGADAVMHLTQLSVSPTPVHVPGNLTVSFSGYTTQDLQAPIKLKLEIHKKEGIWIKVPCIDHMGSCTYDDICDMASTADCPPAFKEHHIPCTCPVPKGNYTLPDSTVYVPISPSKLEKGEFKIESKLEALGKTIGCIHLHMKLK